MEKKPNKPGTNLMIAGLFIIGFAQITGRLLHFPGIVQVLLLLTGLGCEIAALVKMSKKKSN